jgi:RNA polymerase sigma-70 factor (ECF subfamily)
MPEALPHPPDEVLVARVVGGDIEAFDQLVVRYQQRLYGVIYNMTSNHEDTNDILMEVFDRAFRALHSFKKEASFYTWIHRISLNTAINYIKKHKKRANHLSLNDMDFEEGVQKELLDASAVADPEKQAKLKELQIKLNESLQKLSEEHRAVIVLFDIEGLSHAEIGQIVGCSEGTVRSRLHYAHKQLQKYLGKFMES